MSQILHNKKNLLLSDLRMLALRHNRDYYISLIPIVENAGSGDEDLIDMYQAAIFADRMELAGSRQAFESITQVENILSPSQTF